MAAKLPEFRRVPGPARRYETLGGATVSYREYRKRLEAAGKVERLGPVELANRRRSQRAFNDIVSQMVKVRREALSNAIENAEEMGDDDTADELRDELRTIKSRVIKAPERKEALKTLARTSKRGKREIVGGRLRYKNPADELAAREALIALGRREGVPDWVPVGFSDRARSGRIRSPAQLPRRFRAA